MLGPLLMPSRKHSVQARLIRACRAGDNASSRIASDRGASGPLAAPWTIRASTNWIEVVACVARMRASANAATEN